MITHDETLLKWQIELLHIEDGKVIDDNSKEVVLQMVNIYENS